MEYNTPSGTLDSALDKFIYGYVEQGYDWELDHGDIFFTKGEETITALATFDDFGLVMEYAIVNGKVARNEFINKHVDYMIAEHIKAGGAPELVSKERTFVLLKELYNEFGPKGLEDYINNWTPNTALPKLKPKGERDIRREIENMKSHLENEQAENEVVLTLLELINDGDISLETAIKHAEKFEVKGKFMKEYEISQRDNSKDKCEKNDAMERYEVIAEFRVVQVLDAKDKEDAIQQLACNITDTFDFGYELSTMVKYTVKEANNEEIGIKESVSCFNERNVRSTGRK